jgi:hypothetical protein
MEASAAALNSLLSNPNVTHENVISTMVNLVNQGIVTPEQGQQAIRELPGRPEQLRQYLVEKGLQVMDSAKRMEMLMPKREKVDNNKVISFVDTNPLTNPAGPAPVTKTTTPGEDLSAQTQRRGQDFVDRRSREATDAVREANANVYDPERGMLVNRATGLARPATTFNGQPLGAKPKDLTDAQSKALLFGTRMAESDKILNGLAEKGTDMPSIIKKSVSGVPVVGGALGAGANLTVASKGQQKVEQAQRDFINAVLRRESGAVISEPEFANAQQQYFPQVGDSAEVRAQKARNRKIATDMIMAEVPLSRRNNPSGVPAAAPASASGEIDFQLPPDIMGILNKHGAK